MNRVKKKILYYVSVRFVSPVSVSSGDGEQTDGDVLRDFDRTPFIAGSSLAGAMRAWLGPEEKDDNLFGYSNGEESGKMSRIFVSDLRFAGAVNIVTRDGVGLTEKKTALTGAKYDMEAIDSGAEGYFVLELVVREQDDENWIWQQLGQVLYGLQNREIRLGCKKTRGYGELEITAIRKREYTKENILEYRNAYEIEKALRELPDCREELLAQEKACSRYVRIEVPLRLRGGISIRQYAAKKGEPDFVHITANGRPVIPGTSFAGAIRSRMKELIEELGLTENADQKEQIIRSIFGYVDGAEAHRSNLVIGESVIEGATELTVARTAVSRFESAAKKGSLYKEKTYVGGTLTLRIEISKDIGTEWVVGLLLPVLKDLQKGYLPVGGQTSIGRGLLEENGPIKIDGKDAEEAVYFRNFPSKLEEGMVC